MPPFGIPRPTRTSTATTTTLAATTATTAVAKSHSIAPNDFNVPQAGDDGISSLTWSPTQNYLASTNWDGGVRLWEAQEQGGHVCAKPKAMIRHAPKAPVLDCCFSPDGTTIFSGGGDKAVRMWKGENPPNNIAQQIGVHDAPVKAVRYIPSTNMVVSGGWDRKLKFWDQRTSTPVGALDLPERVYGLDVKGHLMVAVTANRNMLIYDVRGQQPVRSSTDSSTLPSQPRCVACLPDNKGFAVGLLDGRVRCQVLPGSPLKVASYTYRCHRRSYGKFKNTEDVYSVNSIAFHPTIIGAFATGGSDGAVAFWHFEQKVKLQAKFQQVQRPIPCLAFNAQGNLLAYASSYDWSKGSCNYNHGSPNEIFIHYTTEEELKRKEDTSKK